jgi:MFS transporter, FHS family, L-fucose permease
MSEKKDSSLLRLNGKSMLVPFILVTSLFFFWGVANNLNDTMLAAFKKILCMTDVQTSFIQMAFYGAYFCLALPAALFIKKFSYKSGVLLGLALYGIGAFLYYPAGLSASFGFHLFAIFILASGCSILETTSNPYILSMGSPETATRRLNLAQAFNPLGAGTGIILSMSLILNHLNPADCLERNKMAAEKLQAIQAMEFGTITFTYVSIGVVTVALLLLMILSKMPKGSDGNTSLHLKSTIGRLFKNKLYKWGVVAQFFYVGAQVGIWSFTIRIVMSELKVNGQFVNEHDAGFIFLLSLGIFTVARFIFTYLMRFIKASKLIIAASIAAFALTACVVLSHGLFLVICLVGISFFMSLMFPTIYGFALDGLGDDAKVGASGLIMAILGGALLTPAQGLVSDLTGNINLAFLVPMICFVIVGAYGLMARKAGE